jgi:hypothetical protein
MRLTAPIQLLLIALTATQSSALPLDAPPSDVTSREYTDLTSDTAAMEKRSYQDSCNTCSISNTANPILRCRCKAPGSAEVWTELALNNCIANRNGQMTWAAGSVLPSLGPSDPPTAANDSFPLLVATSGDPAIPLVSRPGNSTCSRLLVTNLAILPNTRNCP